VLRASAVGLVLVCVFVGAPVAVGQQGTTSYPEELWKAYPLEQRPTTQAAPPAIERRPTVTTNGNDHSGTGVGWLVAAGAGAALTLILATAALRRRKRAADPDLRPRTWRAPPSAPPAPKRRPRTDDPVCQVRWNRSGGCFVAVTKDADGAERRLARSPRVDWIGPGPPEEQPEAQAALRVLSKQLRDLGWRPLRARGIDFDERRWYARRFRWPTEPEGQESAGSSAPREQVGVQAKKGEAS
jgi:hypothetical protein